MSIGGGIVALVLLAIVGLWVATPLFRRASTRTEDELKRDRQRARLLIFYERMLTNIRDLDEDHSTGKMPTADYAVEREARVQRGIQVLKALDRLDELLVEADSITTASDDAAIDRALDAAIEEAITTYRDRIET